MNGGFTLIEFIGVMAVVAIMAAMVTPTFIKRIDHAAWTREKSDLEAMKDALVTDILRTRSIPSQTTWAQAIGREIELPISSITTTPRRLGRVVAFDQNGWFGTVTLPYVQGTTGLSSRPTSARLMIISTIAGPALPTPLATEFDNCWNTLEGQKPSTWAVWQGQGDDLRFQRIDLSQMFHKLILMNRDPDVVAPFSLIETNAATRVLASGSQTVEYLLEGTVINFYMPSGVLQAKEILYQDESFVFENGRWGRRMTVPEDDVGEFGQWAAAFLEAPAPPSPDFAATQQAFYSYLWGYADWAAGDTNVVPLIPPFHGINTSASPQYPAYSVVYTAQVNLANFIKNLIN
jgi:prepilin-type N-terminal cleavage/methylation domain-containing protein